MVGSNFHQLWDAAQITSVMKTRIMLADDHPIFLEGLRRLVIEEDDMECVGTAMSGEEAISLARETKPDIAMLDIAMPDKNGIMVADEIKSMLPETRIIILSAYKYKEYVDACLQVGVDGYILKDTSQYELLSIIRIVRSGKSVFNLGIGKQFADISKSDGNKTNAFSHRLSYRELQVMKLACMGMSNKEISREIGVSVHTVETYFVNIFKKLRVQSRLGAAVVAIKEGLIVIDTIEPKTTATDFEL
ncbi:MAG: response regulator [Candidatus Methanospirareceae archaeon]